ncbi:hypothetical protein PLESTB_000549500 [Pleodorina starrii]|uniref:EF-hand domain-containing protein n=1 Tax=Pleodorina starrii TaxID=330485 RepID=A0A9W6BGM1_9CHLO|nr:hypothetical protein PLESTM_000274500 [Pleodorina starrii]GLC51797.1 hypothetical protein PLESTB_000549500 [Pleodorina starrii]GLC69511.1 hypothetical protein PLESTF_000840100 [Pleodorina starrii]
MVRIFGKDIGIPGVPPRLGFNIINSKWFEKQCRKAFDECDVDRDGALDNKEVYIGLLKMYDLINRKLPYHVRLPSINEVNQLIEKYDKNENRRFEFSEFLECCKGLIGHRKDWKDSLFLKIGVAVLLKALGFPYMAGLLKQGANQLGITAIQGVPVGAITYLVESAAQQLS